MSDKRAELIYTPQIASQLHSKLLGTLRGYDLNGSLFGDTLDSEILHLLRLARVDHSVDANKKVETPEEAAAKFVED